MELFSPCKGELLVMEWEWLLHKTRILIPSLRGTLRKQLRGWWDPAGFQDRVTHGRFISKSIFVAFVKHFQGLAWLDTLKFGMVLSQRTKVRTLRWATSFLSKGSWSALRAAFSMTRRAQGSATQQDRVWTCFVWWVLGERSFQGLSLPEDETPSPSCKSFPNPTLREAYLDH